MPRVRKGVKVALVLVFFVVLIVAGLIVAGVAQVRTGPKQVRASAYSVLVNLSDLSFANNTSVQVQSSGADANPAWRDFLFPNNSSANYTLWVASDANAAGSRMDGIVRTWPYGTGPLEVTGADASRELFVGPGNSACPGMVVMRYNVVYTLVSSEGPSGVTASSLPGVGPAFRACVDLGAPGPTPPPPPPQLQKIESFAQVPPLSDSGMGPRVVYLILVVAAVATVVGLLVYRRGLKRRSRPPPSNPRDNGLPPP